MIRFSLNDQNPGIWDRFKDAHRRIIPALMKATGRGLSEVAGEARENVSGKVLKVQTGRLRASIVPSVVQVRGEIVRGSVGTNVSYGKTHEYGTGPFTLVPTRAKALRFMVGGRVVFAKSVNHPGLKARPFIRPAFIDKQARLKVLLGDAYKEAI